MLRYQVQTNKTINHPDGTRYIAKGVTMFDYLLVSFEPRTDQRFRETTGTSPAVNVSKPTMAAKSAYINENYIERQIRAASIEGVNMIRLGVEPACQFTASYVDQTDGKTYPGDMEIVDQIVAIAGSMGIVVLLSSANDRVSVNDNVAFMVFLANRYKDMANVWINPANEINCMDNTAACSSLPTWEGEQQQYVAAIRNQGFLNPIVINPMSWGFYVGPVAQRLTSNPTFANDPNLIIGVHTYKALADNDFTNARKATEQTSWANYLNQFCIIIEEIGIDNFTNRFDPDLDANTPSSDMAQWGKMKLFMQQWFEYAADLCKNGNLNGVVTHMWHAYIPGVAMHDDNSLRRRDGCFTTFGNIWRKNFMQKFVSTVKSETLWNIALVTSVSNQGGNDLNGCNSRCVLPAAQLTAYGDRARFTLRSPIGKSPYISDMFIAEQDPAGDAYDFIGTPRRVLFDGYNGVTLPAGGNRVVSDETPFTFAAGKNYVLSYALGNANSMSSYGVLAGSSHSYKSASAGNVAAGNVTGYITSDNIWLFVEKIEVA